MEVSAELHALDALPPVEGVPGTHWIGGWVGFRTGLDAVVKRRIPIIAPGGTRTPIVRP